MESVRGIKLKLPLSYLSKCKLYPESKEYTRAVVFFDFAVRETQMSS